MIARELMSPCIRKQEGKEWEKLEIQKDSKEQTDGQKGVPLLLRGRITRGNTVANNGRGSFHRRHRKRWSIWLTTGRRLKNREEG